jgi:hypothetical protein
MNRISDALTEADGSFVLSTYNANDGVPAGSYVVTVAKRDAPFDVTKSTPNRLPERYAGVTQSPLRLEVKNEPAEVMLRLAP